MAKTANLYARIEPELKEQAESILSALGIPASNAISIFYKQIVLQRGLPFEVRLPKGDIPTDMATLTREQLHVELQKGYEDVAAGHTKSAKQVFDSLRKDYSA